MSKTKKKIRFDIISIFPQMFEGYFSESIIARGRQQKLLDIRLHDLRRWSEGRHRQVDDRPFGGGPGMVMMVGPFFRAIKSLRLLNRQKSRIILMSAKGRRFTHREAVRLAKYDRLVLLCGRYEGVDERVAKHIADEELSVGDFVLTGGELAAMIVVDAVSRQIPGVLGKKESLNQESHVEDGVTEYPQYTRPADFSPVRGQRWPTPKILLSGDHQKIETWRQKKAQETSKKLQTKTK
ncbi:tRNA (guanosine(37)-N1)-methyltransferase TrmD [Candidatus Uhrbacteria bacterium RIFOXYC2_FULL_47_19]|uniref:tRNA (guanine-N(1)-)-methyltransferase n=1 Tax=Candidatus Uhrbacteria bacterium RIFOXYC2_FULL_47_19 TaxID=1802424 RepID=A0A1F7WEW3_9BACT|nr:MAG: tRNA (guanosine(37)-N1)-methyltransferase TrmD [Candidatus Uhrbacteria bacterium RIFOXYC2_FULL_47_19]